MDENVAGSISWLEEQKHVLTRGFERISSELIKGLEKELKRKCEEYRKELKQKDEQQQFLSGQYNEEIIKNAHLLEENSRLRRQIEGTEQRKLISPTNTTHPSNASLENIQHPIEPNGTGSSEEYHDLTKKFNNLHKQHQEISKRLKYIERKNIIIMQKNKEMKESVVAWQKYYDRQSAKKKVRNEEMTRLEHSKTTGLVEELAPPAIRSSPDIVVRKSSRSPVAIERLPAVSINLPSDDVYPTRDEHQEPNAHNTSFRPFPVEDISSHSVGQSPMAKLESPRVVQVSRVKDISPKASSYQASANEKLPSSQTTEDEIITHNSRMMLPLNPTDDDNDNPEFVSARSLKRKRASPLIKQPNANRIPSDGTPINPFRVKEELLSSPPAPMPSLHLLRKETLDLDELGPNIISTPHRRQIQWKYPTLTESLQHQRPASDQQIKEEMMEQIDLAECETNGEPKRRLSDQSPSLNAPRAHSEPSDPCRDALQPLQPLDPNVQTTGHAGESFPSAKRLKKGNAHRLEAYRMLSESGDEPPPMDERDAKIPPELARTNFNRRLRALKETGTPVKTPSTVSSRLSALQVPTPPSSTGSTATRSGRRSPRKVAQQGQQSASRTNNTPDSRPTWPATRKPGPPKPQDQRPLRLKPVSELKASDFKANPKYNQGYSYAFTETVRNRSDRACLPGCVRSECCGSTFRALASAAPPLSPSAEELLLQDYLGDAYDTMALTQMSREEREELVLQARTRELANKHGRHRQAYERPTTPPGFWRVDFPTTQEHEEDRRKAIEAEKKLVDERRAEALRKGGKWMFRDE